MQIKLTVANNLVSRGWLPTRECVKRGFHIVVSVVRKKIHRTDKNFMESSRTNVPWVPEGFFSFGVIYKRYRATSSEKKNPLVTAVENLTSMIWNYEHSS